MCNSILFFFFFWRKMIYLTHFVSFSPCMCLIKPAALAVILVLGPEEGLEWAVTVLEVEGQEEARVAEDVGSTSRWSLFVASAGGRARSMSRTRHWNTALQKPNIGESTTKPSAGFAQLLLWDIFFYILSQQIEIGCQFTKPISCFIMKWRQCFNPRKGLV